METVAIKKSQKQSAKLNGSANGNHVRLSVNKTYKMYVDGKFIRSESGRYFKLEKKNGETIANICRASRKDFRDAVVVARKAQPEWSKKSAYNKGQILYRIAEVLEGRKAQFIESFLLQGVSQTIAEQEITAAIDSLVYYAGWCDKYIQLFSSVNPVESSHFNFSYPEPTGVVGLIASETSGLLGLVSLIAPAIIGGNTVIVLADEKFSLTATDFTEVLHASDVSSGVVNILTGYKSELLKQFATHMDVNAVVYGGKNGEELKTLQLNAALNVKRIINNYYENYFSAEAQNPYHIMDTQEIKTTWHPVGL
ncbi:MAG: aldehyde dehydrogenase family protein [Bacteroidia bacterium]